MIGMKKILITILIIIVALITLVAVGVFTLYKTAPDRINVLVVGTDQRGDERSRSDVLMVFSVPKNPGRQTTLLTIPRDTYVPIEGHGKDKITHSYVYGESKDGKLGTIDLTKKTVEDFLKIDIQATLEFNFESFSEIVDSLGGVTVSGEKLDGEAALAIVRDRYREGGDFARTGDQREVFQGVLEKAKSPSNAKQLLAYMETSKKSRLEYSTTRLAWFGAAYYLRNKGKIELGDVVEEVVPGAGDRLYTESFGKSLYYWVPNEEELEIVLERGVR